MNSCFLLDIFNSEIKFFKITGVNPDPSTGHLAVMPANYSEPTNTTASYGTNYLSQFQVNSFSGGGAGVGGNANGFGALPVEWLDFNVVKNNNDAIISWSTFENNNKGFEIQRSTNGIDFKSIDFVNSLANQSVNQYLKTDFEPGNEVFYYRIAQIDLDGKISFSQIKSVNFKENLPFSIDLYPNPAQYHTQILIQSNKPSIEGENKLNIDLENITSGMYIIEIEIDGIRKQIKLIKNL